MSREREVFEMNEVGNMHKEITIPIHKGSLMLKHLITQITNLAKHIKYHCRNSQQLQRYRFTKYLNKTKTTTTITITTTITTKIMSNSIRTFTKQTFYHNKNHKKFKMTQINVTIVVTLQLQTITKYQHCCNILVILDWLGM